jgi:hypothetical protein
MKYTLALFFIVIVNTIFAQDNGITEVQISGASANSYFETKFRENFKSKLSNIGQIGFCVVKFKLSKENKVKEIEIAGVQNSVLSQFISDILNESGGLWTYSSDVKEGDDDINFLLPISYVLQKDGKAEKIANDDSSFLPFITDKNHRPQKVIILPQTIFQSPFEHRAGRGKTNSDL